MLHRSFKFKLYIMQNVCCKSSKNDITRPKRAIYVLTCSYFVLQYKHKEWRSTKGQRQ